MLKWMRDAKYLKYQEAGLPPPPEYLIASRRRPVPWEGLFKVVMAILAAIVTGYVSLDPTVPHINHKLQSIQFNGIVTYPCSELENFQLPEDSTIPQPHTTRGLPTTTNI